MTATITIDTIRSAADAIADRITRTPLLHSVDLDRKLGISGRVYFKCENFQVTHSFKIRGALNAMLARLRQAPGCRFLSRSSGNFAQAVSYAAKQLGVEATVVVPTTVSSVKRAGAERWGAKVLTHGTTHEEAYEKLHELQTEGGGEILSSYDDLDVIAGQGTIGLELLDQLPSVRSVFCPLGGGGLLAGTALAVKSLSSQMQVFAVEPEGADDYAQSRAAGKRIAVSAKDTIADGLKPPSVGLNNWPILQQYVDDALVVADASIIEAMRLLYENLGIIVEPSAAISLAGLIAHKSHLPDGDHVCILSGGNVERQKFFAWMQNEY